MYSRGIKTASLHAGLLEELGAALGDVAQAPLPGLAGAPSGLSLGSVLESVANLTGTYSTIESTIERTGDALATGNFTEVRLYTVDWLGRSLCFVSIAAASLL